MLDSYVVVDLEMTGLKTKTDSVIEIGALKVTPDGEETYSHLVKPRFPISDSIARLTGITNEMVEMEGLDADSAMEDFFSFAGDLPLVGHMISCDYAFLKQWAVNHDMPYERVGVDTLKLARKFLPELESKKLEKVAAYFGIENQTAHRALSDAVMTRVVYENLCESFEMGHEEDFVPKMLHFQVKKQTMHTAHQVEYLEALVRQHGLPMPEGYESYTRGEMSKVTDQIIAKYGRLNRS